MLSSLSHFSISTLWVLITVSWIAVLLVPHLKDNEKTVPSVFIMFLSFASICLAMWLYPIGSYWGVALLYAFIAFPLTLIPTKWWQKTISIVACFVMFEAYIEPPLTDSGGLITLLIIVAIILGGTSLLLLNDKKTWL